MFWNPVRALAISAHTDDAEFGAGGTIAQLVEQGVEIRSIVFSIARESVPTGFPEDILLSECKEAHRLLGIPLENVDILDFPVRHLPAHRQDILEHLVRLKRTFAPDLVLVHSSTDIHQDHSTVYSEALRAFRTTTILGYHLPWDILHLHAEAAVVLEKRYIDRKVAAIKAYQSQQHRVYANEEAIRSWVRSWGTTIHVENAELFEVIRWIIQ